jgi:hypothetical protein
MTDTDDVLDGGDLGLGPGLDLDGTDAALTQLLAGEDPGPEQPAWAHGVAVLVRAARAPGHADELAGEADIVGRMADTLRAARARRPDVAASDRPRLPEPVSLSASGSGSQPADATHMADHDVTDGPLADVVRLGERGGDERLYRAKHAAARLEASRHPPVRTLGRIIAMKAAAATTAAVIGVAAAAAATTGIVATVVVPALSEEEPPSPDPTPAVSERSQRTSTTVGARGPAEDGEQTPAVCPMVPTCMPRTATTAAPGAVATTTIPATSPSTTVDDVEDEEPPPEATTTTVPSSTTTTASTSTTTTTTAPPTTVISVPEPPDGTTGPGPAPLAADTAGSGAP